MRYSPTVTQRSESALLRVKGFTLIELLVVITIIGILSAVVLASLNTARNKGSDAAIKSNILTIRTQSTLYYDNNSGYSSNLATTVNPGTGAACAVAGTMFVADANVSAAIAQADKVAGGSGSNTAANPPTKVRCANNGGAAATKISAWSISVPLVNNPNLFFCIDSVGNATTTGAYAAGLTC